MPEVTWAAVAKLEAKELLVHAKEFFNRVLHRKVFCNLACIQFLVLFELEHQFYLYLH